MLKIAVLIDPLESLNETTDTTLKLLREGGRRGHAISIFHDTDISIHDGEVVSSMKSMHMSENGYRLGEKSVEPVRYYDVLLMRKDPPIDMSFITAVSILALIEKELLAINSPSGIILCPEKIWPATFKSLHPPTLISSNQSNLLRFKERYGDIVLKPLYNYCGGGIYHSLHNDRNFRSVLETYLTNCDLPIVAQKYIAGVTNGDRRIILLGGEVIGALNRTASPEDHRCNMYVGGMSSLHELSSEEKKLCDRMGPWLVEHGLHFVGIDVIDGYVTEVNTTSPTGLVQIESYGGPALSANFWDYIEELAK